MQNKPERARPLYTPERDFNQRKIPATRQPERIWFRVHRSGESAIQFAIRPHHRFSHPNSVFPWLYAGANIQVSLWEYFGDEVFQGRHVISGAKWEGCSLSQITIPEVTTCAVNLAQTRNAMGVDKASLLAADLAISQAWGLAIQQHPAEFNAIKYTSRFLDKACLALFARGGLARRLKEELLGELSSVGEAVDWLDKHNVALL